MADTLGDYLKALEATETGRRAADGQAVYVRIDGNRFSKFTRGMQRPFDERLSRAMIETTCGLVKEFGAALGYTQSDEISLVLWEPSPKSELAHGGKLQKIVSRTASKATHLFYRNAIREGLSEFIDRQFPEFDSRAFPVSLEDAAKCILWREIDATKNAIQMVAQCHFSSTKLHGKNGDEQIAMLAGAGVTFASFPEFFRRGSLIRRVKVTRGLTAEELEVIPERYRPEGPIERSDIIVCPLPGRNASASDRVHALFWQEPMQAVEEGK